MSLRVGREDGPHGRSGDKLHSPSIAHTTAFSLIRMEYDPLKHLEVMKATKQAFEKME